MKEYTGSLYFVLLCNGFRHKEMNAMREMIEELVKGQVE